MIFRPFILVSFVACSIAAYAQADDDYARISKSMELFGAAFREITTEYVDETDPEKIISAGIRGMLDALDPYSTLIEDKEDSDIDYLTSGQYVGFGFSVVRKHGAIFISDVRATFPAANAGVRIGDQLVNIDGVVTDSIPVDSLRRLTSGSSGAPSTLKFVRRGLTDTLTKTLKRVSIAVSSVDLAHRLDGNIGYISLKRFMRSAGRDVRAAYLNLSQERKLNGLIIDLRNNPGGLLDAAINVAEIFLPSDALIVSTIDRYGKKVDYYSTTHPLADSVPLVLLIDGRSASASEVLAGAIQDNDRGIVIGEKSFGKGLVQTVVSLPYDASMKITTSRYYSPSGRCIQKSIRTAPAQTQQQEFVTRSGRVVHALSGIEPDSVVPDTSFPIVVKALIKSDAISSYATQWSSSRQSLPKNFTVDRPLQEDFYRFVNRYQSDSHSGLLGDLSSARKNSQSERASEATIKAIDVAIQRAEKDFERGVRSEAKLISILLDAEIRSRFETDSTRIIQTLRVDPMVSAAVELLRSGNFATFLGGGSGEDQ